MKENLENSFFTDSTFTPSSPLGASNFERTFEIASPKPHPEGFKFISSPDCFLLKAVKIFCKFSFDIPTPVSCYIKIIIILLYYYS